jgi:hypothetical protein
LSYIDGIELMLQEHAVLLHGVLRSWDTHESYGEIIKLMGLGARKGRPAKRSKAVRNIVIARSVAAWRKRGNTRDVATSIVARVYKVGEDVVRHAYKAHGDLANRFVREADPLIIAMLTGPLPRQE